MTLTSITFPYGFVDSKIEDITYFAFCYPFSYTDCINKFGELKKKFRDSKDIYFHSELAIASLEGRAMEIITVSSYDGIRKERDELIPGLFPSHCNDPERRPFK